MWTKMDPEGLLKLPPLGPQIAKDEKLIIHCFSLLYLCLQCDDVFMTL